MKSRILMSAASAVALCLAAPAIANDPAAGAGMKNQGSAAGSAGFNTARPGQFKAESLKGKQVENAAGEEIGEVSAVIIDQQGEALGIVLDVGGFLGMGERDVAIGWDRLQFAENGERIRVNATQAELESMPEYQRTGQQRGDGLYEERSNYFERKQKVPLPE